MHALFTGPWVLTLHAAVLCMLQTPALEQLTGYKVDDLRECVHEMHGAHVRLATEQSTLKAVRDKYSHDKHYRVSLLQPKQL